MNSTTTFNSITFAGVQKKIIPSVKNEAKCVPYFFSTHTDNNQSKLLKNTKNTITNTKSNKK